MRYTKTLTGTKKTKKTKPLDAPNIDRHQKNQKNQKFQQLLRSGPIVPGNFSFFGFFGACAGLVHLVVCFFLFVWCLCRFGDSRLCMFGSWPCFKVSKKQTYHYLWIAMPPHRLPDLNSQQHDTLLCLSGFLSLSGSLALWLALSLSLSLPTYWNETADKTPQDNNYKQDMYLLLEL